jgi:hypothetical protein
MPLRRITHAEALFGAIAPATGPIQMPPFAAFAGNVAYYSTPAPAMIAS